MWEGKYGSDGRKLAPLRVALPFQTVETVNESAQERQRSLDLFGTSRTADSDWRNRLIWGDNKYVLAALLEQLSGKVRLIYIDPPFATGQDFSFRATIESSDFVREASVIEQKAYRDTWGRGIDSFLQMLYERFAIMYDLLTEDGTIYVHMGWEVAPYVRVVLDEIFGRSHYVNQVIWRRQTAHSDVGQGSKHMGPIHDVILVYGKGSDYQWNMQYQPYSEAYIGAFYNNVEPDTGRRYRLSDITGPGGAAKGNPQYEFLGVTRYWRFKRERMEEMYRQGRIVQTNPGTVPAQKRYLDEMPGVPLQDLWLDINTVQPQALERVGYDTQKPEALLDRIIRLSSNPDDIVGDFFAGSGTTVTVAEKLGRRWVACDLSRFAIHTTRKRLLGIAGLRPFVVQNLGKYERQVWQMAEFGETAAARAAAYRAFILELYNARPVSGYTWLHGLKLGRLVHVGTVDAPVTVGDVKQIAVEFRKAVGKGVDSPSTRSVDVLGWDFAFEVNEVARQDAAKAGIDMRFVRIPREVLDKRAVDQGDIHFFELAALAVGTQQTKRRVTVTLTNFIIPLDDVPEDVQRAVNKWPQWIDYWAVDWDNHGDTFHNEWQTYRSRRDPILELSTSHEYEEPGEYTIVVKVIDILGNDTTKSLSVTVPDRVR